MVALINLHPQKPRSARQRRRRAVLAFVGAFMLLAALVGIFGWYPFDTKASPVNWGEVGVLTVLMIVMIVMIFLIVEGGVCAHEAGYLGRVERGTGVLARWTLDAKSWREIWELRRALDQQPGTLKTSPVMPAEAPPGGVEIIISEDCVCIGPEFWQPVPAIFIARARLSYYWLEIDLPSDDEVMHLLRVPVPHPAREQAEKVVRHFSEC